MAFSCINLPVIGIFFLLASRNQCKTFSFTSGYVVFCSFDRIRSALSLLSHLFRMLSLYRIIPRICVFPTLRLCDHDGSLSFFLCLFTTFTRSSRVKYFIFFVDSIIPTCFLCFLSVP